ncbi:MAG TPA: sigma-70 family RNA polymerase sigma factor [Polyangium sp.]|nr:sigma-70 family RNA polymerase sigma factor [Polyangium sp.]
MSTTAPKKRKRLTLPKVRDPRRFVVVGPELPKWPPGPPTDPAIPHDPTVQAKRYAVPNPHPSLSSKEECRIFISLYSAHREFVRRTVERHGVPIRDSDDITQEVFAIALQRIKDFDAARAARPWLFVIAIQRAANYRRLARNRREPLSPTPPPDPPSEAIDSESALLASEARSVVRDLIGRLSPKLRAILVMHDLEERPIDEIANEFNLPLRTARARL